MKLNYLFYFIVLSSFSQLYSQQFYLKAFGGYGIGTSPDVITTTVTQLPLFSSVSSTTYHTKTYSFGEGLDASIAAGYKILTNLNVEMEIGYHRSTEVNYESSFSSPPSEDKYENKLTARTFNFIPSVVLHTEISSIKPYLKIGPVISIAGIDYTRNIMSKIGSTANSTHFLYEYRGGITFGVSSSAGIQYSLGRGISIMFEINNKNMTYSPKEGEITEYTVNGVNRLEELKANTKKFSFKESLTEDDQQNSGDRIKEEYPFSSLSFLLGAAIEF